MPTLTTSRILRSVADNYHISVWKTDNTSTGSSNDNQVKLPLESTGTYNFKVDWGDGTNSTITAYNQAEVTHTYASIGTYTIKIIGTCKGFRFNNTGDKLKILDIQRWGKEFELGNSDGYFYGCTNLIIEVNDNLKNPTMTSLQNIFRDCYNFNHSINSIDTSNITDMTYFLGWCKNFNQSVSNLNTSKVTSFTAMFYQCRAFNQSVSNFNTSNVTTLAYMFTSCTAFNQDISGWNIEKVTNMTSMLQGATSWSQANYDLFLIGAHAQALTTGVQSGVQFRCDPGYTAGGAAQAAHDYLFNVKGWIFADGGLI